MKTFKTILIFTFFILSNLTLAGEWSHVYHRVGQYDLRFSYTKSYVAPTYGFNGGVAAGFFYIDVSSLGPVLAQTVEIIENTEGRTLLQDQLNQTHQRHAWVGRRGTGRGGTYADFIWIKKSYLLKIELDGQIHEIDFQLH